MNHLKKLNTFALPVLLALMVSTFMVTPVLADDGTPPPTETPTEAAPPQTDTSTPEIIVTSDRPPADPAPAAASATESAFVANLLAQVPEGTEVVVSNSEGQPVPLVTGQAASAIEVIDPIWCPTGVAPKALTGGCSASYPNLGALVGSFAPAKAGVIWIQGGADSSPTNIQINGSGTWASAANFALTLKGGWNGVDKSTVISGYSTFFKSIAIIYWNAPVTLSDITISGAGSAAGVNNSALEIVTTGNIDLNRVNATLNGGTLNGAYLNNTTSTKAATVTVSNGSFSTNSHNGLYILSDGAITLNNVIGSYNSLFGVYTSNISDNIASPITITGCQYAYNSDNGLFVNSNGAIVLNNIYTVYNTGNGALINNLSSPNFSGVTILNSAATPNVFYGNSGIGLAVYSTGVITAKNLVVTNNNRAGAEINNSTAASPKAVTLSGLLEFNDNHANFGLGIYSQGVITLGNLTANGNIGIGVDVNNTYSGPIASAVKISGNNSFNLNSGDGLRVISNGAVTLNNTTANHNGGTGVLIQNSLAPSAQDVSITGFLTSMVNQGKGLNVISIGNIKAANLTISNNYAEGATLQNLGLLPKAITITGFNAFNENGGAGLRVWSYGAVSISNITANWNGLSNSSSGVYITNAYNNTKQMNVTLSGYGVFEHNANDGLVITSYGIITLSNITANENSGNGAYIMNAGGAQVKVITLTGINSFNYNGTSGSLLYSSGNITTSNLTASGNYLDGLQINNTTGTVQSNVTLSGYGVFNSNGRVGLYISSNGSVTTNNLNANFNRMNGVYISVSGITAPQSVTLNGNNNFNFNATGGNAGGLQILADGNIKVNNVTATDNNGFGAWLDNYTNWAGQSFTTYGSITQTGFGNFVNNINYHGLYVHTPGSVFLNRVTAAYNGNTAGDDGIHIIADHDVTLTCVTAYHNFDRGVFAYITGKLTLKGLFSYGNSTDEGLTYGTLIRTSCP